ncbi:GNAT family N-acetyltransferase [Nocardioides hwasunensis]|uniref:GNAT family N-acetyltransferase n=1 Tax=Nocardioides hwasunensis TaxID=397258 RepID=A0ABR8MNY7_9ACTN|nr:GNAT family N-acetyltransferase [Nocardioides hwasunensis]MBD3915829.1 GNAT family N-acetyltransferase [Nocardioides hwasunensis]
MTSSDTSVPLPVHVRRAGTGELPRLGEVLRDAFADHPWTRWTIPDDDHIGRLAALQAIYLDHATRHGGRIWVSDELDAVAVFVPADLADPSPEQTERILAAHGDRVARLAAHEERMAGRRPAAEWTLATMGVLPAAQGSGRGSALLRAGLADLAGSTVMLETSQPSNVRLYERHGFVIVERLDGVVDGDGAGPPVWVMVARPAG